MVILELIRTKSPLGWYLLDTKEEKEIHDNCADRKSDVSRGFLPYQLLMVGSRPTMVVTGNGE